MDIFFIALCNLAHPEKTLPALPGRFIEAHEYPTTCETMVTLRIEDRLNTPFTEWILTFKKELKTSQ